jgi:hypothetical protein
MDYVGLFTRHHVAVLHDWLTELGELFIDLEYPHSGGGGRNYFVHSLEDIKSLISEQTHPEIKITIFRASIFPIRGKDYLDLLERALKRIPENQYYQIVVLLSYPGEYEMLTDGKGHEELRRDIANLEPGHEIAIGVHPFDPTNEEFEQFYGGRVERLYFEIRKNLNSYTELINHPDRYQDALDRWFGSIRE